MAFSVQRVGQFLGARADRIAVGHYPAGEPQVITLVWNGSQVKHTQWFLLPDGDLFPTELHSQAGGPELAVAAFSESRLVSVHRSGPAGALKFEAWKTGGSFELSDDAPGPADRDPEIVTFGADPGILPFRLHAGIKAVAAASKTTAPLAAATGSPGTQPPETSLPAGNKAVKQTFTPGKLAATLAAKVGYALVVSRTPANRLRVSVWGFDNGGDVKVLAGKYVEADGGPATAVSVAKVKEHWGQGPRLEGVEVVTAARGENQVLRLQRWRVNVGDQDTPVSIQLLSEHTAAETITQVSAVPVVALNGTQAATAVRLADGALKVIGWRMNADGSMSRWAEATGGTITSVSAAAVRGRTIVTALREADGRLKTSYWRFPADISGTLEHRGDAVEGPVSFEVQCAHVPAEGTDLGETVVATQSERDKLQLFRYRVTDT